MLKSAASSAGLPPARAGARGRGGCRPRRCPLEVADRLRVRQRRRGDRHGASFVEGGGGGGCALLYLVFVLVVWGEWGGGGEGLAKGRGLFGEPVPNASHKKHDTHTHTHCPQCKAKAEAGCRHNYSKNGRGGEEGTPVVFAKGGSKGRGRKGEGGGGSVRAVRRWGRGSLAFALVCASHNVCR